MNMAHTAFETISSLLGEITLTTIIVVGILLVLSFISWVVILWKTLQFARVRRQGARAVETIAETSDLRHTNAFFNNQKKSSPFSRIFSRGMRLYSKLTKAATRHKPDELEEGNTPPRPTLQAIDLDGISLVIDHEIGEERKILAGGLGWLSIIAHVAPLLGLLGTCTGIMSTFLGVKAAGVTSIAAIAPGVSEALVTTIAGLIVAIPAAVGKHALFARLATIEEMMEWFANEMVNSIIEDVRGI